MTEVNLVTLSLKSPLLSKGIIMPDAIVMAELFDQGLTEPQVNEAMPFDFEDGIYWTSCLFLLTPPRGQSDRTITFGLRNHALESRRINPAPNGKYPMIYKSTGAFGMGANKYQNLNVEEVGFLCVGHNDKIFDAVQDIYAIGARRNVGYGEIESIDVTEMDLPKEAVLIQPDGQPFRPLPTPLWERLNKSSQDALVTRYPYAPPYSELRTAPMSVVPARTPYWSYDMIEGAAA